MKRHVCVHGHYYQPPRENPWTGEVVHQPSAAPFHDWNERVTRECYAPNAAARLLDGHGRIVSLVNLFRHVSHDVGPTLASWLADHDPEVFALVTGADGGRPYGPAMAQGYHHTILPLADPEDRATEIAWGVADFRSVYGRAPEGLWLPETAVDTPTLEALAAAGIAFTVLAPHQGARWRFAGDTTWRDEAPDPRYPYRVALPSGASITVFLYDGGLSQGIAFGSLLTDGDDLAARLASPLDPDPAEPQLVSVATDGETYGHHHRFGEMALARALSRLESRSDLAVTTYAEFLATHPPRRVLEIAEPTSWSCAHGVERWRSDCGCHTGGEEGSTQAWRGPLREALDALRADLAEVFEREAAPLVGDPWAARRRYGETLRLRTAAEFDAWFAGLEREPAPEERDRVLGLLEMQRNALRMYTSCGWFFHDLAGIETVQILAYAARAAEQCRALTGHDPAPALVGRLESILGNDPDLPTGRAVWERAVLPMREGAPDPADAVAGAAARLAVRLGEIAAGDRPDRYLLRTVEMAEWLAGRGEVDVWRARRRYAALDAVEGRRWSARTDLRRRLGIALGFAE